MTYSPSLPEDAGVRHILGINPRAGRALIEFRTAVLRQDTELTARHKEMLAAYVSGLNACAYCHRPARPSRQSTCPVNSPKCAACGHGRACR
jgi:alkylhydroperoxidase family enzyme